MTKANKSTIYSMTIGLNHIADVIEGKAKWAFAEQLPMQDALRNYAKLLKDLTEVKS